MSGFEAIEKIMEENPLPIIVVSSMDIPVIIRALGNGAMGFVAVKLGVEQNAADLLEKVKIASRFKPLRRMKIRPIIKPAQIKEKESYSLQDCGYRYFPPVALKHYKCFCLNCQQILPVGY